MNLMRWAGFRMLKLGLKLLKPSIPENAYWALDSAVRDTELVCKLKLPRYRIDRFELMGLIEEYCNCSEVYTWDGVYYYTDVNSFKRMVQSDVINRMKYISEVNDCDDFARDFSTYMDIFFQLNSVGTVVGTVTVDGAPAKHSWNCVILRDENKPKVFYYEPQSDKLGEVKNGVARIGDWVYKAEYMIFG